MRHTLEPWQYLTTHKGACVVVIDTTGRDLLQTVGYTDRPSHMPVENARRIVACVNACYGIATSTLETYRALQPAVQHEVEIETDRDRLVAQNAELVAALEANHQWHIDHDEYDGYEESYLFDINTSALTKVKGEQA